MVLLVLLFADQSQMDTFKKSGVSGYSILKELTALVESLGLQQIPHLPSALRNTFSKPREVSIRHMNRGKRPDDRQSPTRFNDSRRSNNARWNH
jgi:hypothetical protein